MAGQRTTTKPGVQQVTLTRGGSTETTFSPARVVALQFQGWKVKDQAEAKAADVPARASGPIGGSPTE